MRVLIAEQDYPLYAQLLGDAAPDVEVLTSGDSAELSRLAADCPVWLGQPDLLATLLRQGHQPQWLQSTWAGITPLLADGLPRDYRLTRGGHFWPGHGRICAHLHARPRARSARAAGQPG